MKNEFFFIIGAKRSGTTLLRLMLNNHSNLSIPPESHFFIDLLNKFNICEGIHSEEFNKAISIIQRHPRFVSWNITQHDFLILKKEIKFPISLADLIYKIFRLQIKNDSVYIGEKTPEYVDIIPQLKQLYPQGKFIVIYRDGRDVSLSLKNRGWNGWTVYQRAFYWRNSVRNIHSNLNGNENSIVVNYEDLIINPQEKLSLICNHLYEIEYQNEMLEYSENYQANITEKEKNAGLHAKLARKPKKSDLSKWKKDSSYFEIWAFECLAFRELQECGYELACYKPSNIWNNIGRLIYIAFGSVVSVIYSSYHKLIPKTVKTNLRKSTFWNKLRMAITK